jgi:DnaK suppressor protein
MIVSILQLMGFPMAKPVHSRADKNPVSQPPQASAKAQGTSKKTPVTPARRPDVKAQSGKKPATKAAPSAKKVVAKAAKAPAKPSKPVKPAKPAVSAKGAAKPPTKAPVKTAGKPLNKGSTKAAGKSVTKPAAKPSKPQAKSTSTVVTKLASKSTVAKPATKAATKPTKPNPSLAAQKAVGKAPAKPAAKAVVKPPVKVPAKAPAATAVKSAATTQPAASVKAKPGTAPAAQPAARMAATVKPVSPMPPTITKPAPSSAVLAPIGLQQKPGRPSSRLAQLTVPSMAQSVASTAAKASYSQTVAPTLIVPVAPALIKKDPKLANHWKTKPAVELTDAELMAMPDAEYMNEVQLTAFRHRLSVLKREILNSAGETTEHLREDTSVVPDPADRATIEEEHALELRTRDRERKLLKKIEQSIARIDAGDYGYCDETGEPIGVGRLLARPTATLSLEAQQRRELKQKMFGD